RSATAQACLLEALAIPAKLPSGYQRDLQLLKFPLFRAIDLALATLDILPPAIAALGFRQESIRLDPAIHAAEEANRLVLSEGIRSAAASGRVPAKLGKQRRPNGAPPAPRRLQRRSVQRTLRARSRESK